MSVSLSFFAFEPGAAGVPAGSGTGAFVTGLVKLLRESEPGLEVHTRWLRPVERRVTGRLDGLRAASRWVAFEVGRMLRDRSRYLLFIYPKLPILAHVEEPTMLRLAHASFRVLAAKSLLTRQRVVVIIEDLPVEMAEGRAISGGSASTLNVKRLRGMERTLFRSADRIVLPAGFVDTVSDRYGLDPSSFRTFRRNMYPSPATLEAPKDLDFESGKVNFFYSGAVDSHLAANFREVLRSIRNAPEARLHVCGPGVEPLRDWLSELDVPNVRQYGQLRVEQHDWLARQCDVGLILYPTDNPYNHLTPTMKYSAYLANGLAVLSTDLRSVAENVRADGVGQAMPIRELALEILRWATRPKLWPEFKSNAAKQAEVIRSGSEMKGWVEEIAQDR